MTETLLPDYEVIATNTPTWTQVARPAQTFNSVIIIDGKVYDIYTYAGGAAIGLRYGNHPRDERTHSSAYWARCKDRVATNLVKAIKENW